jgi:hypothetical protein
MVQILPPVEHLSYSSRLGKELGTGISRGVEAGSNIVAQLMGERIKQQHQMDLYNAIKNRGQMPVGLDKKKLANEFAENIPQLEQSLGRKLAPEEKKEIANKFLDSQIPQESQAPSAHDYESAEMFALTGQPELARLYTEKGKQQRKEEFSRESAAETKLGALEDKIHTLDLSDARYQRLSNLFSPEKELQFPPSLMVGLFTKEGELNPVAASQLSEDAQEALKLLSDEVQGVKDTFGSQISGFEVRQFMKRLPSLLNSSEGKRRVLRDLQMINKLNRDHDEGILNIVDRYGGPGKISVSKAQRIWRKENAPALARFKKEFAHPESVESDVPFDPAIYQGRTMVDDSGKEWTSNGKEWIPAENGI